VRLDTERTANFIRHELAEALRKGPYQVNCILGGFDGDTPKLFWIDYLGTLVETKGRYCIRQDMTLEEGINLINYCIKEIQTRFMASQPSFVVKLITKDGVKIITPIQKPIPVQCG
jgi:20S proteasome subunit beta 4